MIYEERYIQSVRKIVLLKKKTALLVNLGTFSHSSIAIQRTEINFRRFRYAIANACGFSASGDVKIFTRLVVDMNFQ